MGVGIDVAITLTGFDHGCADTVLHAVERLEELTLGKHGCTVTGYQTVDLNHGGIADCLGCIGVAFFAWHGNLV